jgi:hypothetical protein
MMEKPLGVVNDKYKQTFRSCAPLCAMISPYQIEVVLSLQHDCDRKFYKYVAKNTLQTISDLSKLAVARFVIVVVRRLFDQREHGRRIAPFPQITHEQRLAEFRVVFITLVQNIYRILFVGPAANSIHCVP